MYLVVMAETLLAMPDVLVVMAETLLAMPDVLVVMAETLLAMPDVLVVIAVVMLEILAAFALISFAFVVIRLSLSSTPVFIAVKLSFTSAATADVPDENVFGIVT